MKQYLELVQTVLDKGVKKEDRTGTGTLSYFGAQLRFNLEEGFPLLTTKKVLFDGVVRELLWFIKGSTNIHDGLSAYTPIWNAWADDTGYLGPIYGYQWRFWEAFSEDSNSKGLSKTHIDQLAQVISEIKKNPHSRRLLVSAWNVADISKMALPPCHILFQFYVRGDYLDCQLYQRSADLALGVPFNIASYALLLMMVAQECQLRPGEFIHTFGDVHIYLNHVEGLKLQLQRQPLAKPKVIIQKKPFFDLSYTDIALSHYQHHPFIKFEVSV